MKILSRPSKQQPCEDIVLASIKQLYDANSVNNSDLTCITLAQYQFMVNLVLGTLQHANVIKSYHSMNPVERPDSTYLNELWEHRIGFTGDGKEWYTLQLDYNFTRTS
jgi:hypothetical protein